MSVIDNWSFNYLTDNNFAPWDSTNYADGVWNEVPISAYNTQASSTLSIKLGLQGFDLTSVHEACKTAWMLMCEAFDYTDGWAMALTAVIPVVDTAPSFYGVWFRGTENAFLVYNMITAGDTSMAVWDIFNMMITENVTSLTPNFATLAAAAGTDGHHYADYGLTPNFFELGDYDLIDNNAQKLYAYTLMGGNENNGLFYEVGDTIDILSITT